MIRLNDILDKVASYNPTADLNLIRKAYVYCAKVHQGQTRLSGEPYIIHPMEVAGLLAELRLDVASVITGFLHDTIEDTLTTAEELTSLFGDEVATLVDGVTKISKIHFKTKAESQAENFRKMLLAMSIDIRVILVKLADRLHNMRTLEFQPELKQRSIAQETMDIYAPIANRLGISWIKVELEDLSFRYLNPEIYFDLARKISLKKREREAYVSEAKTVIADKLGQHRVQPRKARQGGGGLGELGVVLHGAGAEGIEIPVHAEVAAGQLREVADHVQFAQLRQAGRRRAQQAGGEHVRGRAAGLIGPDALAAGRGLGEQGLHKRLRIMSTRMSICSRVFFSVQAMSRTLSSPW